MFLDDTINMVVSKQLAVEMLYLKYIQFMTSLLCAIDNSLDEVVAEHLLEVGDVAVVHDGEVLLVDVQVGEVEGHVGEPQPEAVVRVYLRGQSVNDDRTEGKGGQKSGCMK